MKLNRILQLSLLAILIIFLAAGIVIYTANSSEAKKQTQLTDTISKNQAIINKGLADRTTKEKEGALLAAELTNTKNALAQLAFRPFAESVEYDRILFSIANDFKLQVTNLTASPPQDFQEKATTYQINTFTVNIEGKTPGAIFKFTEDSVAYNAGVTTSILDYVNKIALSPDFDTAVIQSINISAPKPLTSAEIDALHNEIENMVQSALATDIDLIKQRIEDQDNSDLTSQQIQALVDKAVADLVQKTLASKTQPEIQAMLEKTKIDSPSAVITITIWTNKGA